MKTTDTIDIDHLFDRFERSSLAELHFTCESYSLTLKRSAAPVETEVLPQSVQKSNTESESVTEVITAPIVGTFYLTPAPDALPYVGVGSTVKAGDVLCTIEAMKLMNQLEAEYSCEIVKILAKPEQMVAFGSPLFEVKRL